MKHYYPHIIGILSLATAFAACEQEEPTLFNAADNGVYFNYDKVENLKTTLNFANYIWENPDTLGVQLNIKLLGMLSDRDRKVVLKSKPVEGYPEASFQTLPEVTFAPGEYEKSVRIYALRPEVEDTTYAANIYIESEDEEIGSGISGFNEFTVYTGALYSRPDAWVTEGAQNFFGDWNKEKQIFLVREVFESDSFVSWGMDAFAQATPGIVDMLREMGDETDIEIPFYYNSMYSGSYAYSKPPYWGELQEKYIRKWEDSSNGSWIYYSTTTFLQLASNQGLTTKTDEAYFTGDESRLRQINKTAVELMETIYDNLFLGEQATSNYEYSYWVPMFADIDYDLTQPVMWSSNYPGTNALLEKYYGPYSLEKFKFMVKALAEAVGPEHTSLAQMFPVSITWDDKSQTYTASWGGFFDENWNYISGESYAYEMNTCFRAADTTNEFNFPVVSDPSAGGGDDKKDDDKK